VALTSAILFLFGMAFDQVPFSGAGNPLGYGRDAGLGRGLHGLCLCRLARLKANRIGPVMKRYRRRLAVAMIAYCVVLIGSLSLLRGGKLVGPLLWIVAAAPAIPILGVLAVMGLYLKEEPDEFERAVQVEAMLWGLGAVLAVTTVWGFLSNAGVVPAPPLFLVFPLFCLSWGISQPFIRRRYQ
jgi:hypothetical protein